MKGTTTKLDGAKLTRAETLHDKHDKNLIDINGKYMDASVITQMCKYFTFDCTTKITRDYLTKPELKHVKLAYKTGEIGAMGNIPIHRFAEHDLALTGSKETLLMIVETLKGLQDGSIGDLPNTLGDLIFQIEASFGLIASDEWECTKCKEIYDPTHTKDPMKYLCPKCEIKEANNGLH